MSSPRIIAARNGERKYTGKACKACGETEKYVINAACVACTKKAREETTKRVKQLLEQAGA